MAGRSRDQYAAIRTVKALLFKEPELILELTRDITRDHLAQMALRAKDDLALTHKYLQGQIEVIKVLMPSKPGDTVPKKEV